MEERAVRLQKVSFTSATIQLAPQATARMAIRAEVPQPQPALIITARMGTKMHRSIDRARASMGRRHRIGAPRRRHWRMGRVVFTGSTMGLVRQTLEGFGLLGAFALGHDGHRFG